MAISDQELALLVDITGKFENSKEPYIGVSGNFDGQGISCGVLQWNIGQGSLQPLVIAVGEPLVLSSMPKFGAPLWTACHAPLALGLKSVVSWQPKNSLPATAKRELQALMGSTQMRAQQDVAIKETGKAAEALCAKWVADRGAAARTVQELCWFFDLVTQNNSLKGLSFAHVKKFKAAAAPGNPDDLVCDWLIGTNKKYAGMEDCHKNADLWRGKSSGLGLDLLILSYLRSQKSKLLWRGDVLNRKGTLALKKGWVHQAEFDFSSVL
jgi:hypothetical protein